VSQENKKNGQFRENVIEKPAILQYLLKDNFNKTPTFANKQFTAGT
jgi:hypothetical protein